MNSEFERSERWEPISGLPEAPMSGFECSFVSGILTVTADYASSGAGRTLKLQFGYVEAFKVYEEFSDPWMENGLLLPQIVGLDHRWRWPLQEIVHSAWVARILFRNGALEGDWRHFKVSTQDRTLHVMTSDPLRVVELT